MKMMRKFLALLLCVGMMMAVCVTARGATANPGSITIENDSKTTHDGSAVSGATYTAYRILDLESYDANREAYLYKLDSAWTTFFADGGAGHSYMTFENEYILTNNLSEANAGAFAKAALAFAKTNNVTGYIFTDNTASNLPLGYYVVDTTMGSLCALTTTNPTATVEEKNVAPTITKAIQGAADGTTNTASIGDTVNFTITIAAKKGAQNYVLHDWMDSGFTLVEESIAVKVGENPLTATTDYSVEKPASCTKRGDNATCSFHINFTDAYLDSIAVDTNIVVTYLAKLNANAGASNVNHAMLTYGEGHETAQVSTTTNTYSFDIVKTDAANKLLDGATFKLFAEDGTTEIKVEGSDGSYKVKADQSDTAVGVEIAAVNGKATVSGLAGSTTYQLVEQQSPAGYNKLTVPETITIGTANITATVDGDTWSEGNGGVHIVNQAGALLPSTGGVGTTIFYVVGAVLVAGAGILLITKKRMDA